MKVCPRCGRTEKEVPFIGFFCKDCYLEMHKPVEIRDVELKVCSTCGRVFVGRWTTSDLSKIANWVKNHIKISPDVENPILTVTLGREDEESIEYWGVLSGVIQGTPIQYRFKGIVRKVREQCPICARRAGGYYEAVVQLRGSRWRELYSYFVSTVVSDPDPKSFISKEVPRRNGVDLFIGSKKVAERIARKIRQRFGVKPKFSFQLVTEKDGRPITREFVALRLD